jgi:hypothetical protein
MKIKIMFDEEVVWDNEVKSAEISESRECTGIFKTADFKATGEHKIFELAPSIKFRLCIDYLSDNPMPNSEFYTMVDNSLPHKFYDVTATCPECKKDIVIKRRD